jgi:hypothetical protein
MLNDIDDKRLLIISLDSSQNTKEFIRKNIDDIKSIIETKFKVNPWCDK